jgi:hypothetical protein
MTFEKSLGLAPPVRVALARLSWISATSFSSPMRWRQTRQRRAVEGQLVLEELLAAEQLKIGVLDPAFAQGLVGEIVHVLQDREAGHQPRRQGRTPGNVGVNRAEALLQKAPVDRRGELRQGMAHVDDLIEPRAKQILLPAVPPLLRPHRESPFVGLDERRESQRGREINLQENRAKQSASWRKRLLQLCRNRFNVRAFVVLHERLIKVTFGMPSGYPRS